MTDTDLARIARVLNTELGATAIGVLEASYGSSEREGYWERAYAVAWKRASNGASPREDTDGFTYGTHRVHVNSEGKEAAFEGHYDLTRAAALADLIDRSELSSATSGITVLVKAHG